MEKIIKKLVLLFVLISSANPIQKFRIKKYLESRDTTKAEQQEKEIEKKYKKFSIKKYLKKTEKKKALERSLEGQAGFSNFTFASSDGKIYTVNFSIDEENYQIFVESEKFVPPYVIDEAKFVIAFNEFIKENFGNRQGFVKSIDDLIESIDNGVEAIIGASAFGNAIRELGEMAAINIYYGGLGGQENKAFLQKIAANYVANIAYDISTYYGFSATDIGGKVVSEIIKTASSLFLTRKLYSDDDVTQAIVEDVEAGFFAQIAMGKRMLKEATEILNEGNDYETLRDAYEKYRIGKIHALSALKGLKYLEEENFANQIAEAIGSIIGSYIEREIEESLSGGWKEAWDFLKSVNYELSEDEKRKKLKKHLKINLLEKL